MNHKPTTPLPWLATMGSEEHYRFDQRRLIQTTDGQTNVAKLDAHESHEQDARYIAHAANSYPRAVTVVRDAIQRIEQGLDREASHVLEALLKEFGEA